VPLWPPERPGTPQEPTNCHPRPQLAAGPGQSGVCLWMLGLEGTQGSEISPVSPDRIHRERICKGREGAERGARSPRAAPTSPPAANLPVHRSRGRLVHSSAEQTGDVWC